LFSRFSGGAPNNNLDFSGIAKNSFYIEDGKIRHALDETMVSDNFRELLQNVHAVEDYRAPMPAQGLGLEPATRP
jgi:PmbA protein